ncbi:MAG: Holliday junction resolvase RuvX [Candidatus Omnitrophota bacterium]
MRILGLDIGEKRIGVAISDETQTIAQGLKTLSAEKAVFSKIEDIISEYDVKEVVVGLPIKMNGTMGLAAEKVLGFSDKLKKRLKIAVYTFDERLTTRQGEVLMLQADISRKKRKMKIDKIAAQIMLQTYMDSNRASQKCRP